MCCISLIFITDRQPQHSTKGNIPFGDAYGEKTIHRRRKEVHNREGGGRGRGGGIRPL